MICPLVAHHVMGNRMPQRDGLFSVVTVLADQDAELAFAAKELGLRFGALLLV
jgi:hypothetical protein